jgi:hypothetical protein
MVTPLQLPVLASLRSDVPVKEPVVPAVWKARVTRLKSSELLLPQTRYGH